MRRTLYLTAYQEQRFLAAIEKRRTPPVAPIGYPGLCLNISDGRGEPSLIVARLKNCLRAGGVPEGEVEDVAERALAGNYDELLHVVMATVDVV